MYEAACGQGSEHATRRTRRRYPCSVRGRKVQGLSKKLMTVGQRLKQRQLVPSQPASKYQRTYQASPDLRRTPACETRMASRGPSWIGTPRTSIYSNPALSLQSRDKIVGVMRSPIDAVPSPLAWTNHTHSDCLCDARLSVYTVRSCGVTAKETKM